VVRRNIARSKGAVIIHVLRRIKQAGPTSVGAGFQSQPDQQISGLRIFVVFSVLLGKCWIVPLALTVSFHIHANSPVLSSVRLHTVRATASAAEQGPSTRCCTYLPCMEVGAPYDARRLPSPPKSHNLHVLPVSTF
jgi:hypothetical protein